MTHVPWSLAIVLATNSWRFQSIARGRMAGSRAEPDRARTAAIIVWALAEGQALVGIVGTMLTGDRVTAYASLALFAWLWMRYPPGSFTGE